MHVIQYSHRIYSLILLCLCAAFFLAPSLANANEYWSVLERRFIPQESVPNAVKEMLGHDVKRPVGSTLVSVPSAPTVTKNPTLGLSASTNQILKNMGFDSGFTSTTNYSLNAAKSAFKSCVRSPSCAGRALGGGAIIYEGIQAWKDVYDILAEPDGSIVKNVPYDPNNISRDSAQQAYPNGRNLAIWGDSCPSRYTGGNGITYQIIGGSERIPGLFDCWGVPLSEIDPDDFEDVKIPVPTSELDQLIDEGYEPAVSDAPIVLLSNEPSTITLSTPAPVELPSTTTTSTNSAGQTTTKVTNQTLTYEVQDNETRYPSINSSMTTTTNTYDSTGNLTATETSTTTEQGSVQDTPSAGASADVELPVFCTWAKPLCDWLNWTQEEIEGEEPDLINLISEFEPDENQYNSGIGSGSCPAPMSLNLGIINRTVEVSYQPICDFLDMIRPLVIAGAWLLSAFMYVGVLRRG